jgi:MerR family transcriptional regulator, light-induced transcriptional regulator
MTLEQAYTGFMKAIRAGDRRGAFDVVDRARTAGIPVSALYVEVFQPVLREVGRLWQENQMSVAEEHLATGITQAAMASIYAREIAVGGRTAGPTVLAATAEPEEHVVGLRMVCDMLEADGWDVIYLGGSVPEADLAEMVRRRQPDVVALGVTLVAHIPRLRNMIDTVRAVVPASGPVVMVGGRPFLEDPDLARRTGADLVALDAVDAVRTLNERFAR